MNSKEADTNNNIVVYSLRCAGFLMLNGCVLLRMEQSRKNPSKKVFIFYNDEKVNMNIRKYTDEVSKNHEANKKIYNRSNREQLHQMEQ